MDQLELLKKDWKKQESTLPKLSKEDISKLIHKKSSSIVKWIFIISVLELVIPYLGHLFIDYDKNMELTNELGLSKIFIIFYIIGYAIVIFFIFRFYKNYRSISANSNSKELMQNIIKTRRTVKYYIWFNLAMVPIIAGAVFYKIFNSTEFLEKLPEDTNMIIVWLLALLFVLVMVGLVWLFYRLLYGILLNKLKKNYNELVSNGVD
jgi:MFS family permease